MNWTCVNVQYDGEQSTYSETTAQVAQERRGRDRTWDLIVNLPKLVVLEWNRTPSLTYIQYIIYVREDLIDD